VPPPSRDPAAPSPPPSDPWTAPSVDPALIRFLLRTAELLHAYGTPAHRLERLIVKLAADAGQEVQVFSSPTSIFLGFEGEQTGSGVRLLRVQPGGVDLGRLMAMDEVLEQVEDGDLDHAAALVRMEALHAAPTRGGVATSLIGHALAAGAAAIFFGGCLADALLSAAVGLVIGLLERVSSRKEGTTGTFEPFAAFLAAGVGLLGAHFLGGAVDDRVVALASVIVLVPGLSLTVALVELATRNLASGTARLAGAMTVFLTIAFGAYLGRLVVRTFVPLSGPFPAPEPEPWLSTPLALAVLLTVAATGFGLLFGARLRELPWILGSSAAGFMAARCTAWVASNGHATDGAVQVSAAAAFAGALAVAAFSNAYARLKDRPATVPLLPGLLVLVPGAIGYRALSAFADQNALDGVASVYEMLLVGAALVGGTLTANVVVPPRRVL
jgi:uncharacterized membrane protein YjjP (DUF1212 family)